MTQYWYSITVFDLKFLDNDILENYMHENIL